VFEWNLVNLCTNDLCKLQIKSLRSRWSPTLVQAPNQKLDAGPGGPLPLCKLQIKSYAGPGGSLPLCKLQIKSLMQVQVVPCPVQAPNQKLDAGPGGPLPLCKLQIKSLMSSWSPTRGTRHSSDRRNRSWIFLRGSRHENGEVPRVGTCPPSRWAAASLTAESWLSASPASSDLEVAPLLSHPLNCTGK